LISGATTLGLPAAAQTPSSSPKQSRGGAPGASFTFFDLTTSAASATLPFVIGIAVRKGGAPRNITTDLETAQVDVKRRWNDGSVKHAIIAGRAALTRNVARRIHISTGTQLGGKRLTAADIKAAKPQASVQCGAIGTVNLSTLLAFPFSTWTSGSEMVECRYRADVGGGTLLAVWFRVRLFADGRIWVRVTVENGYLDNGAGAISADAVGSFRSYVPIIVIGRVAVFNNGGASFTHYKNARYFAEGWIGGDPRITPKHDVAYLMDKAKLVPNYAFRNPSEAAFTGNASLRPMIETYTPGGIGMLEAAMGAAGFSPSIGLLPMWQALYATSGDPRAFRTSIASALSLNSFPLLQGRSFNSKLPIKISDFPTWSHQGPFAGIDPALASSGAINWDGAHFPSSAYFPYLLTGDEDLLETMKLEIGMMFLTTPVTRGTGFSRAIQPGQPRGTAWYMRSLGQCAAIAPDGDAIADEYRSWLSAGLTNWKQRSQLPGSSQIGYLFCDGPASDTLPYTAPPWQYHFQMQAYGHIWDIETGIANPADLQAVRDFLYQGVIGILGPNGVSNFCFTLASDYEISISSKIVPFFTWLTAPEMFQTWGEVFQTTHGVPNRLCANTLLGVSAGTPTGPTGRWANLLPAIAFAVDHGAVASTGATAHETFNRLSGADNWQSFINSGFDNAPIFGIMPRSWSNTPAWAANLTLNQWVELAGTQPNTVPCPHYATSNNSDRITPWCGLSIDTRTNKIYSLANGGHLDYFGNEVTVLDCGASVPGAWTTLEPGSTFNFLNTLVANGGSNSARYSDGKVTSTHSYYLQQFIEARNRAFRFGVGSCSTSGFPKSDIDAFDITNNTWDAAGTWGVIQDVTATGLATCKNPVTEDVYQFCHNKSVQKWTQATRIWSMVNSGFPPVDPGESASAYDTVRNRIFLVRGTASADLIFHTFDPATGLFAAQTPSGPGAAAVTGSRKGAGMIYEPNLDAYLVRFKAAGSAVYKIDAATFAVTQLSTTGGSTITATVDIFGTENVYGKWLYAPKVGSISGVFYVPAFTSNVWFLRTH